MRINLYKFEYSTKKITGANRIQTEEWRDELVNLMNGWLLIKHECICKMYSLMKPISFSSHLNFIQTHADPHTHYVYVQSGVSVFYTILSIKAYMIHHTHCVHTTHDYFHFLHVFCVSLAFFSQVFPSHFFFFFISFSHVPWWLHWFEMVFFSFDFCFRQKNWNLIGIVKIRQILYYIVHTHTRLLLHNNIFVHIYPIPFENKSNNIASAHAIKLKANLENMIAAFSC